MIGRISPALRPHRPPINRKGSYIAHACIVIVLGAWYAVLAPANSFGPTWSYFADRGYPIAAGGTGIGVCLASIGLAQLFVLWRNMRRPLEWLFFLSGTVFWIAAAVFFAEGLLGHQGYQEAPGWVVIGGFKFVTMVALMVDRRAQ
jgi:hypothetical protein